MQHEFDNTIDSILRRAASVEREPITLSENSADAFHLEPDEIAAFAENVLPPKTRLRYMQHFADCDSCRQTLATFAAIEVAENEPAAENIVKAAPARLSWSERVASWFSLPNLGYAMAALTVLLIGGFAFVALRSMQESRNAEVAFIEPETARKQEETKNTATTAPPQQNEVASEHAAEPTPAAAPNANLAETTTTAAQAESNNLGEPPSVRATKEQADAGKDPRTVADVSSPPEKPAPTGPATDSNIAATAAAPPPPAPQPAPKQENKPADDESLMAEREAKKDTSLDRDKAGEDDIQQRKRSEELAKTAPAATAGTSQPQVTRRTTASAVETRNAGGRTFTRQNGVWTDAAYKGQTTINVSRNSEEFRKLDDGLRAIAQSLNGIILVVWRDGKAYRIQ